MRPSKSTECHTSLEDMLFKGTENLDAFAVNEAFDRTGAQFNAFTSEENTVYYAAVLPEYVIEVTKLWIELMRPALRDEDFIIEKNVIKEEIAMYKDTPSFDVVERCRTLYFDGHACGKSVLGSEESIDNLSSGQMREYFVSRYAPNNMMFACAGNLDWHKICSTIEESCRNWTGMPLPGDFSIATAAGKKEGLKKRILSASILVL